MIKLKSQQYGSHLHSHKVNYGSGSGQQSVTGFAAGEDNNDYWLIQSMDMTSQSAHVHGRPIKKGDIVILRHMATGNWLHSHLHRSPLSGQQEVSAFDGKDDSNLWEVGNDFIRGEPVRFRHMQTGKYLGTSPNKYGHPIPNQHEIMATQSPGPVTVWVTGSGIYFEADK